MGSQAGGRHPRELELVAGDVGVELIDGVLVVADTTEVDIPRLSDFGTDGEPGGRDFGFGLVAGDDGDTWVDRDYLNHAASSSWTTMGLVGAAFDLGKITRRIPFFNEAETWSPSTSTGRMMVRENPPQ